MLKLMVSESHPEDHKADMFPPHHVFSRMPTLSISLLALFALSASTSAGFFSCAMSGGPPNVKVQFVSPEVGWIVGSRLLQTLDGGRTWKVIRPEGDGTIRAETLLIERQRVQFVSPEAGMILSGRDTILKTADGGRTWLDVLKVPLGRDEFPIQVFYFISDTEGWVVGEHLYYTSDAGQSWERRSAIPRGNPENLSRMGVSSSWLYNPAIIFSDTHNGSMARLDGEVYHTSDGGKTWRLVWKADRGINRIVLTSKADGWLVGQQGLMARTRDGGLTWAAVQTPTNADLYDVAFSNDNRGFIVGRGNTLLHTTDGGRSWKQPSMPSEMEAGASLVSISFADEKHGWAVGGRGLEDGTSLLSSPNSITLVTSDGGQTWRAVEL